eukprot:700399-Pleurochrysis_carterae.AAC.1
MQHGCRDKTPTSCSTLMPRVYKNYDNCQERRDNHLRAEAKRTSARGGGRAALYALKGPAIRKLCGRDSGKDAYYLGRRRLVEIYAQDQTETCRGYIGVCLSAALALKLASIGATAELPPTIYRFSQHFTETDIDKGWPLDSRGLYSEANCFPMMPASAGCSPSILTLPVCASKMA